MEIEAVHASIRSIVDLRRRERGGDWDEPATERLAEDENVWREVFALEREHASVEGQCATYREMAIRGPTR